MASAAKASIEADGTAAGARRRAGRPRLAGAAGLAAALAPLLAAGCITINVPGTREGPLQEVTVSGEGRDKVLVVDLSGIIIGETRTGVFGLSAIPSTVDRVERQLDKAAKDDAIKAVVLRINSPGGTVTGSDVLYHAVRRYKEKAKVPVVAAFLDLAASGGYYVAMASDEIVAHPTTITGSIGVIVEGLNVTGLFEKLGVQSQVVKSDRFKDLGSPTRLPTSEERAIFQGLVDGMFARFLATVETGRPRLAPERVRALADGRIYTADQAVENGLVDRLGYMEDAVEAAKKRAKIEKARVVFYVQPGEAKPTHLYAGTAAGEPSDLAREALARFAGEPTTRFLYLWPGF